MAFAPEYLEELGDRLMAEIGLQRPHIVTRSLCGFVRITPDWDRELAAPWPTSTREALYVLAHEVGHWVLHTERRRYWWCLREMPAHVAEYESERYAHDRLRAFGIPVPRIATQFAKRNVGEKVRTQLRMTTETPAAAIARWAGVDVAQERQVEWGVEAWRALPPARRARRADILLGSLGRQPVVGTRLDAWAFSARGEAFAASGPMLTPVKSRRGAFQLRVEHLAALAERAARERLVLMRA